MKSDAVFLLENAGWPALLVDAAGKILRANQAAVKVFGPPVEGESSLLSTIWSPENGNTGEQFLAQWERSPSTPATVKLRVKGGSTATFSASICVSMKDGQKFFLLQLPPESHQGDEAKGQVSDTVVIHKQKLDCALQLARTVALDFNNALTSILGHTSLLLSKAERTHPWRRSLMEVEKSAARAAEIASDLAAFSRQEKEVRGHADGNLNLVVQHCMDFIQHSQTGEIRWTLRLERQLFAVKFDEAKILQALMKILENAVEAMDGQGEITVRTQNVDLTAPTQDRNVRLTAGTYVCVEISDNGRGIEEDVLPRIFEPFFTTKRNHRGLGLVLAYGIVTNHGGGVAVSSQRGSGTSVRVYLPAVKKIVSMGGGTSDDLKGTETILIVDDEALLLTMGETILSDYGYRVVTANNGQKALELLSKTQTPIDLVVTDLVMPAMSGRELVEHIRRVSPATRIICTSGYVWPASSEGSASYLQKPFTSQDLLMKVKQALGTPTTLVD